MQAEFMNMGQPAKQTLLATSTAFRPYLTLHEPCTIRFDMDVFWVNYPAQDDPGTRSWFRLERLPHDEQKRIAFELTLVGGSNLDISELSDERRVQIKAYLAKVNQ